MTSKTTHTIKVFKNGYTGFRRPGEKKFYYVSTGSTQDKGLRKKFAKEIKALKN